MSVPCTRPASGHPHRPRQPGPGHDPHGPAYPAHAARAPRWSGSRRRSACRCWWPAWSRPGSPGWGLYTIRQGDTLSEHRGEVPHDGGQAGRGQPAAGQRQPDHRRHRAQGARRRRRQSSGDGAPHPPGRPRRHAVAASRARYGVSQATIARANHLPSSNVVMLGATPGHPRLQQPRRQPQQRRQQQHLRRPHVQRRRGRGRLAQPLRCSPAAACPRSADARHHRREGAGERGRSCAGPRRELPGVRLEHARGLRGQRGRRHAGDPRPPPSGSPVSSGVGSTRWTRRTTPRPGWSCSRSSARPRAASGRPSRATTRGSAACGSAGCSPTRGGTSTT